MSCNSESRRVINYSLHEPINNKYDLWLSENLRYNSEGTLVYDSPGQPACDFILKIYKDGDWRPIAGLSTEHVVTNKINIVKDVNYTYISPNDNELHVNNGFQLNHLPLFRNPQDSPNEFFDAGTLGEAIYGFVNESEWLNIFGGNAFSETFTYWFPTFIEEGNIDINTLINPAGRRYLGGIWADEFLITDIFPSSISVPSTPEINNSHNWIALAKYKYNHSTSDYNLYVSAKDIINIINQYGEYNQDEPGININIDNLIQELKNILKNSSSLGFEDVWGSANDPHVYPHIWGVHHTNAGRFLRIKPEWNDEEDGWSQDNNNMDWVDLREIIPDLVRDENIFIPKDGISISYVAPHGDNRQHVEFGLNYLVLATDGAICRKITSNNLADIEWTPIDEIYPLLVQNSLSNTKYVVKGGGEKGTYLDYNGEWTEPKGTTYNGGDFIQINEQQTIDIKPNSENYKTYLCSEDGEILWDVIDTGTSYLEGVGIKFGDNNSINIDTTEAIQGQVLSYDGDGDVEWADPPSLVEGNNFNTFIIDNKIYIKSYMCIIRENEFILDPEGSVNTIYSNSSYPFIDFTDYQVVPSEGVSSITIKNIGTPYLRYPSYMHFTTSNTKCTFTFPKTMEFIETMSVNSSNHENCYYTPTDYVILLKPETKYNVTFYKSCIKFETNSNSIFNQPLN